MNSVQSRRAARLILLNGSGCVLLFRHARRDGTSFWAPPGGGVEIGETFEQAAAREAAEELGLQNCLLTFLWEGITEFAYVDDSVRQQEQFFLCDGNVKQFSRKTSIFHRREGIIETRWWRVADIEATSEQVFPEELPYELGKIRSGGFKSLSAEKKQSRQRIDVALVERGLAESRQRAQARIMAGQVKVAGRLARKPSELILPDSQIEVAAGPSYASRAGAKLEGALADFNLNVSGAVCADIGASNGGFTDCLLRHGAARVYAVDVNTKQLDWKLQQDSRVRPIEKNARFLSRKDLGELVDVVTIDVSFISATKIVESAAHIANAGATFLILIKPQFELEKGLVPRGGIVRDPALHDRAISTVRAAAEKHGLRVEGVHPSRVTGAEGNQEFFLLARRRSSS